MCHALILDDNMIISRAIENRLLSLGFHSFDHAWTEEQAVAAAELHTPDLVVLGDSIEAGSALSAARRITTHCSVPVLLITADPYRLRQGCPKDVSLDGPFLLNEIETAVELARTWV